MADVAVDIRARHLGPDHEEALNGFSDGVLRWIIPFIREWSRSGHQPLINEAEVERLRKWLAQVEAGAPPPSGYERLPELLSILTDGMRFNARNLVNIHPTPHLPSVAASLAVALQNPNNIVGDVSGPTTRLERESIAWMAERLVGFDPTRSWGNVVSGGTVANMTALMIARDYCYRKLSLPRPSEVRSRGLYGLPAGVVLATAGSHYSVRKALWFLGMGDENVVSVPVAYDETVARRDSRDATMIAGITNPKWSSLIRDSIERDRARGVGEFESFYAGEQAPFSLQPLVSQLLKAMHACFEYGTPLIAYVFTLGTTDTGTLERPEADALALLATEDVYIHADAATGGFAMLHPRVRAQVSGLEKVHSVTIDGHKLGHLPYPNGAIIFRETGWMHEIMHEAPYLRNLAPTLEGSRPGSHIAALWMAIKDMGDSGRYERWLDESFSFVDRFAKVVASERVFQILHRVDLTTIAFAPLPQSTQSRLEVNARLELMVQQIAEDRSENAYLVNLDRGLAGIKVKNGSADPRLVDIYCLRLVAINPRTSAACAEALHEYLVEQWHKTA